jgi:hypothetical protein
MNRYNMHLRVGLVLDGGLIASHLGVTSTDTIADLLSGGVALLVAGLLLEEVNALVEHVAAASGLASGGLVGHGVVGAGGVHCR